MDPNKVDKILERIADIRAQVNTQPQYPEKSWYDRVRGPERRGDWSGSSWSGEKMAGREWGGGRER
jgi:hypothetical protein